MASKGQEVYILRSSIKVVNIRMIVTNEELVIKNGNLDFGVS